jgi:hypothetical protein
LTPESILGEILYESWGLHLIGAPIRVLTNLGGLSQSHLALNQSQIALNELFQNKWSTRQLRQNTEDLINQVQSSLVKHSPAADEVWYHGTKSPRLGREGQGCLPRVSPLSLRVRARGPVTESFRDNHRKIF